MNIFGVTGTLTSSLFNLTPPQYQVHGYDFTYTYPDSWNFIYIEANYDGNVRCCVVIPSTLDNYYYSYTDTASHSTSEFRTISIGTKISISLATKCYMTINSTNLIIAKNSSYNGSAFYNFLYVH